jgi:prepilin-type N-terminal cleavage/methylation domain-containing protein
MITMSTASNMKERHAFTLIELLVVVAIIGILASLLIPALVQGKQRARGAVCLSNLRQLQLAWLMYAHEHDDKIPPNLGGQSAGRFPGRENWIEGWLSYEYISNDRPWFSDSTNTLLLITNGVGRIGPYLKNPALFKCPGDKSWIQLGGVRHPRVRSYAMNSFLGNKENAYALLRVAFDLNDLNGLPPSRIFVFIDEHQDSIDDGFFNVAADPVDLSWWDVPANRHLGALTFADGHAELKKWIDPRTRKREARVRIWGDVSPNNKDIRWILSRTTQYINPAKPYP